MRVLAAIALLSVAAASSGCASRPFVTNVAAPVRFEGLAADNTVKEAKDGDVLFEQPAFPSELVKLDVAVEQVVPVRKNAYHRVKAGTLAFRVYGKNQTEPTYCTADITFSATAPIGPIQGRSCFTDADGDGMFDQVWVMMSMTPIEPIQVAQWQDRTELAQKAAYSKVDPKGLGPVKKGILFKRIGDIGSFQLFERVGDDVWPIGDSGNRILGAQIGGALMQMKFPHTVQTVSSSHAFPTDVEIAGARIEVLGMTPTGVRYRVVSGLPTGEDHLLYWRLPCDPQVRGGKSPHTLCEFENFAPTNPVK